MQKSGRFAGLACLTCLFAAALPAAGQRAPTCDDLNWSVQVVAANPDIREACLGVYVRNDTYYARSQIELVQVRGNTLTFRPVHRDGSKGKIRRVTVPAGWQALIEGRRYSASQLSTGQRLDVFIPEDRFALAIPDGNFEGDEEMMAIEQAEVTTLPAGKTPP